MDGTTLFELVANQTPITAIAVYLIWQQATTNKNLVKSFTELTGAVHRLSREIEHLRGKRFDEEQEKK